MLFFWVSSPKTCHDLPSPKYHCRIPQPITASTNPLPPVEEIEYIVNERGVSDAFMGLILVPLVEKAAEHLTAVDEAWDNQMNFALAHILGATIQTALFNSALVVIVGWGLDKAMDLNFEVFNIVVLIMTIIVVGSFLRDQKSNYMEGSLCILIYVIIGGLREIFFFSFSFFPMKDANVVLQQLRVGITPTLARELRIPLREEVLLHECGDTARCRLGVMMGYTLQKSWMHSAAIIE